MQLEAAWLSAFPEFLLTFSEGLEDIAMFTRTTRFSAAFLLVLVSEAWADDSTPTAEESALIQAHASSWNLLLERQHLKAMTLQWETLITKPDSAAVLYQQMVTVATKVVGHLELKSGYPGPMLMRWVEQDAGLSPFFFPPGPEVKSKEGGGFWKLFTPIIPILLVKVVDRVLD
jgi:hypothetical protein